MALVACHECGHNVSTTAKACPSCGAAPPPTPVPHVRPPLLTGAGWVILIFGLGAGLLVLLVLIAAMRGPSPKAKEKGQERAAIDLCWKDYERRSLDPSNKRFVASACELMEKRFREKHGVEP